MQSKYTNTFLLFVLTLAGLGHRAIGQDCDLVYPGPSQTFSAGVVGSVLGDLDGDGVDDLVSGARDQNGASEDAIVVALGLGDGVFAEGVRYTAYGAGSIHFVDMDGDGDQDILTSRVWDSFYIFYNDGDGLLGSPVAVDIGLRAYEIHVIDIEADGDLDVVGVDQFGISKDLSIVISNGDGSFEDPRFVDFSSRIQSVAIGDIDGDEVLDMATVGLGEQSLYVYLGIGDGQFDFENPRLVGDGGSSITAEDLNYDGSLDLVVRDLFDDRVTVLRNSGRGTFLSVSTYQTPELPTDVKIVDLDSDGILDLVVVSTSGSGLGDIGVLYGTGNSQFLPYQNFLHGKIASKVLITDLNGDQELDFYILERDYHSASHWYNQGDRSFGSMDMYVVTGRRQRGFGMGDFNGDGAMDIARSDSEFGEIIVRLNSGSGTFSEPQSFAVTGAGNGLIIADVDQNGHLDFMTSGFSDEDIVLLFGDGNGAFGNLRRPPAPQRFRGGAVGDVNGDGLADIVTINRFGDEIGIGFGEGDRRFVFSREYDVLQDPQSVYLADLDNDQDLDILIKASNHSQNTMVLLNNKGSGEFTLLEPFRTHSNSKGTTLADMTGDGILDLIFGVWSSDHLTLMEGDGQGAFINEQIIWETNYPNDLQVIDVDGDSDNDVVLVSRELHRAEILYNAGDGVIERSSSFSTVSYPSAIEVADLNQDGALDLTVYGGGRISVSLNLCDVASCRADFTLDGILDFFDVSAFLDGFAQEDPAADLTDDGVFDFFDVSAFLEDFGSGCP
tara:strand:- start:24822 stop:27167 length:2346 start_codon:yes stop_codon:yes gene_type:complete